MNSRSTRVLLTLAVTVVSVLALSAVAQAAAGTVTVYDGGTFKEIQYTGTADVNEVGFGGSLAAHTVTSPRSASRIQEPAPTPATYAR